MGKRDNAEALRQQVGQHVWKETQICKLAKMTLRRDQDAGALKDKAAKARAIATARAVEYVNPDASAPPWDPAIAGPLLPLVDPMANAKADAPECVLVEHWLASGGVEGALAALGHAAKYSKSFEGVLVPFDAERSLFVVEGMAEIVRTAIAARTLTKQAAAVAAPAGTWFQRLAVVLAAPSPAAIEKLHAESPEARRSLELFAAPPAVPTPPTKADPAAIAKRAKAMLAKLTKRFGKRPVPKELEAMCRYEAECELTKTKSVFFVVEELGLRVDEVTPSQAEFLLEKQYKPLGSALVWVAAANEYCFGYLTRKSGTSFVSLDTEAQFTVMGNSLFDGYWSFLSIATAIGLTTGKEVKAAQAMLTKLGKPIGWTPPKTVPMKSPAAKKETKALNALM